MAPFASFPHPPGFPLRARGRPRRRRVSAPIVDVGNRRQDLVSVGRRLMKAKRRDAPAPRSRGALDTRRAEAEAGVWAGGQAACQHLPV